ncbi:condensation domain-containing protein [Actinomadura welshii]
MIRLLARDPLIVRYEGERDAEGPLTIGQSNILRWLEGLPEDVGWEKGALDLPEGARLSDVAAAFAALVTRHEGLRTTYLAGPDPVQRVHRSGALPLHLYELAPEHDPAAVTARQLTWELRQCLNAQPQDQRKVALRAALATRDDVVLAGFVYYSHLAVDYFAVALLNREFAAMVRDPAVRDGGPAPHQPLEQARAERSPRLARRASIALERWETALRAAPQCPYPIASTAEPGGTAAAELRSEAGAMALAHVAHRTGLSRPTIVLAAVCAVLSHRTDAAACTFVALSGNRFDRELAEYVGSLVQAVQLSVDVGGAGFDELARRAWRATLHTVRYGVYDVDRRTEIADRVQWERGVHFSFEPIFNNRVADTMSSGSPATYPPDEIRAARSRSTLDWNIPVTTDVLLLFDLHQVDDVLRLRLRTWHPDRLPKTEIEQLLLGVERLLVEAASGDLDAERIEAVLDLGSIARDDDWMELDSCWIQLSEVQRLVEDAVAPAPARVFRMAGDRPLVAYVAGDAHVRSPEEAHRMCMEALPGRFTAMTPRYYVLCDGVPEDVTDVDGWRRRRVLAEGPGRRLP